ncbi:MAG: SIS domain-containing protein, partial [bacterium]|nr:SIS domain-containing protein [bacterium]
MTENQGNIAENAFKRHQEVIAKSLEVILPDIQKGSEVLLGVVQKDGLMLACGNGGSAADAQHLSGEWLCRYKNNRKPLRAIALSTDTSAITAIGNDYRFEDIFKRQ